MSPSTQAQKPPEDSRLAKVLSDVAQQCKVRPNQIEDLYPCTPLQHGLLALSTASTGTYMAQHVFKLQAPVNIGRMKKAWNEVIRRNAILRTRIITMETRALQVVLKDWPPDWHDCTDLPTYLVTDSEHTMEYGQLLSRLAISQTHLVWTAHHSVYDGYSMELVLQDVTIAYRDGTLPTRTPFRSFIKHLLHGMDKAQCQSFWTSQLSRKDVLPFPNIRQPNYRPRPNNKIEHRAELTIHALSKVTPATIVQAAWGIVLSSHLSSQTVSFGTTLNGRNTDMAGIESVMGPTLSTVPVCLHLDYEQTAAQYLQAVQRLFTQMIPHQHVGLQNIKEMSPETAVACNFNNLFAVHLAERDNSLPPYNYLIKSDEEKTPADFFNYAMTVQCLLESNGAFGAMASFDDTIVDSSQMKRLLVQLEHVIRQVLLAVEFEKKLKEIDLVSPEDLKQIEAWHHRGEENFKVTSGFPLDEIHKHVQGRGDAPAVHSWDGQLSYSELGNLSSRLANYLALRHGVGPEIIVPVCFDKSQWMIVAVVAILKAGGAFSLLDPAYPKKRLDHVIASTGATTILVSRVGYDLFAESSARLVLVDGALFQSTDMTTSLKSPGLAEGPSPESALYVVFTSGSTGQPKGVVVTHGSYYADAMGHMPRYGMGPETRNLLYGSPAFDLCVQEIISTLMAGGCICVPSEDDRLGGITSFIQSTNVNLASFTSSSARQINPDDVPSLKTLALVGEPLAKDQQEAWADRLCLLNAYGPSECSVVSTVNRGLTRTSNPANIGPVIRGAAWIVHPDNHDRLLPIGAAGEFLIEGPHLGRGYLNEPEKTAASFITNPLWARKSDNQTRRFYKTGDIVRYDADGSLIFEGRKDTQVKIRGQRVEIGEIEYHLAKLFHKASGVAVEILKSDETMQLVAFIFCDGIWNTTSDEPQKLLQLLANSKHIKQVSDIKANLREALPHHMVPSHYQLWQKIPILPSGKLDRKQLRAELRHPSGPHHVELLQESDSVSPYIEQDNPIALQLNRKIVSLIAARNASSAANLSGRDFYLSTLGLDSIQLISILTFVRKEFDVKISIGTLYDEALTISGLAKSITDRQAGVATILDGDQAVDLLKQARDLYDKFLVTPSEPPSRPAKTVFLTGATGFLGTQILRQLLDDPAGHKVIVHVRAENAAKALDRIIHSASLGKWWSESYLSRFDCWPGDLAAPKLGLVPTQWNILIGACRPSERIDTVIHNGAAVQWQAPYFALKAANVDSTVELLSAIHQWPIPGSFTYVSGGVKRAPGQDTASYALGLKNANGYSQSKFVAEELVALFVRGQSRHNISIVRPGLIIGTEEEGIPNTDDFLWRLVQACISVGGYPEENGDFWLAVADAGEVADSIIASSLFGSEERGPQTLDIDTGITVQDFWNIVREELGSVKGLQPMKGIDWIAAIKKFLANAGDSHAFQPLMAMLHGPNLNFGVQTSVRPSSHSNLSRAIRKNLQTLLNTGYFEEMRSNPTRDLAHQHVTTFSRSRLLASLQTTRVAN